MMVFHVPYLLDCGSTLLEKNCTREELPWCEASPPNHHDDKVDSDQWDANKELSLSICEEDFKNL